MTRDTSAGLLPTSGIALERTFVTDGVVNAITQGNNQIYIGGSFSYVGQRSGGFAALATNAAKRDNSWPEVGGGTVYASVSDGQGGFYLGGDFRSAGSLRVRGLAHVRADKTVDPAINVDFNGPVFALAVEGSTLYAGGHFDRVGALSRTYLAAIDVATGAATAWDAGLVPAKPSSGLPPAVRSISLANGVVYAAGNFGTRGISRGLNNAGLAAIDAVTGAYHWTGQGIYGIYFASAIAGDRLFVGGYEEKGLLALDLATGNRLDWDPQIEPRLDPAANRESSIRALAVEGRTLYVGGEFGFVAGASRGGAAAFDLDTLSVKAFDPQVDLAVRDGLPQYVQTIRVQGNQVFLGGGFESVHGVERRHLAAVDAVSGARLPWHTFAPPNTTVYALQSNADTVFVAGDFTSIGGVARNSLAALDATTRQVTDWAPPVTEGVIHALDFAGGRVYAGGEFSVPGRDPLQKLVALDVTSGAPLNPIYRFTGAPVFALTHSSTALYAGGAFTNLTKDRRVGLAAVTPSSGKLLPWAPTASGVVRALSLVGSTLYVGGNLFKVNDVPKSALAAVDASSGALLDFAPDLIADPDQFEQPHGVFALSADASSVYAAGDFTVSGAPQQNLAAFDTGPGALNSWHVQLAGSAPVIRALAQVADTLYVGGRFEQSNGSEFVDLAAVDTATGVFSGIGRLFNQGDTRAASLTPTARGIHALSLLGDRLSVGGGFYSVSAKDQSGFARLQLPAQGQ